jgi:hypothetical protein
MVDYKKGLVVPSAAAVHMLVLAFGAGLDRLGVASLARLAPVTGFCASAFPLALTGFVAVGCASAMAGALAGGYYEKLMEKNEDTKLTDYHVIARNVIGGVVGAGTAVGMILNLGKTEPTIVLVGIVAEAFLATITAVNLGVLAL